MKHWIFAPLVRPRRIFMRRGQAGCRVACQLEQSLTNDNIEVAVCVRVNFVLNTAAVKE